MDESDHHKLGTVCIQRSYIVKHGTWDEKFAQNGKAVFLKKTLHTAGVERGPWEESLSKEPCKILHFAVCICSESLCWGQK